MTLVVELRSSRRRRSILSLWPADFFSLTKAFVNLNTKFKHSKLHLRNARHQKRDVPCVWLFILGDEFQQLRKTFLEKHYQEFDNSEENRLSYTSIFTDYVRILDICVNPIQHDISQFISIIYVLGNHDINYPYVFKFSLSECTLVSVVYGRWTCCRTISRSSSWGGSLDSIWLTLNSFSCKMVVSQLSAKAVLLCFLTILLQRPSSLPHQASRCILRNWDSLEVDVLSLVAWSQSDDGREECAVIEISLWTSCVTIAFHVPVAV